MFDSSVGNKLVSGTHRMADQRSVKIINQVVSSLTHPPDYPSESTLLSLVDDNEDILFISPCSVSWDWMKGRTEVIYRNTCSILILTRQRLMLVGGIQLPFQLVYSFNDIRTIYEKSINVVINCSRTLANDPPNPPNKQTGFRTYPKDAREEITYELLLWGSDLEDRAKLFEFLISLPYSMFIRYGDRRKEILKRDTSLYLPVHQDVVIWNQANISYAALSVITYWMEKGDSFPDIAKLQKLLPQSESVFFISKYLVEYQVHNQNSEVASKSKRWLNISVLKKDRNFSLGSNQIASFVILTDQRILLISEMNLDDIVNIEFGDVSKIVDVKENSNYEKIYGRAQYPKLEISIGQQTILLTPLAEPDFLPMLSAIQELGRRGKIITDKHLAESDEYWILKPFKSFVVDEFSEQEDESKEKRLLKSGYIYILINPQLPPNTLKIGKTARTPEERANEIYSTGVPGEFLVAYEEHVLDSDAAEAAIHTRLASYRISDQREFFRLPLKNAVRVVHEVAMEIGTID